MTEFDIEHVRALAREVWNDPELGDRWLITPHAQLQGRRPVDLLETRKGVARVEALLRALFYGLPN